MQSVKGHRDTSPEVSQSFPVQSESEIMASENNVIKRRVHSESLEAIETARGFGNEPVETLPLEPVPNVIRRRIPSPVFVPPFNYTDKAFFGGLILVTIAAFITRLYKLNEPKHVA